MFEEELKKIWQNAPQKEQIRFEHSRLLIELKNHLSRDDKQIKIRNTREIIAGIVLLLLIGYYSLTIPMSLQVQIANLLLALWAFYIIGLFRYVRRKKPEAGGNLDLKTYLNQYRTYLLLEKRFSEQGILWTILPLLPGVTLLLMSDRYTWAQVGWIGLLLFVLITISHLINRHAARKKRQPLIDSIDEALEALKAEENNS